MTTTDDIQTRFETISKQLKLGRVMKEPTPLSGGFLHQMFRLETTSGTYAVKLLNPAVLSRPEARQNFIDSERIVNALQNQVSALPALSFQDAALQQIKTRYYLIFPWIDGMMLAAHQITPHHAEQIGKQLAAIHQADLRLTVQQTVDAVYTPVQWNRFKEQIKKQKVTALEPFLVMLEQIKCWEREASLAIAQLAGTTVLSHRDLDAKNVLWQSGMPTIIDWESAGPIHPMHDFVETALYWSLDENRQLQQAHFEAFVQGYRSTGGGLDFPLEPALSAGYAGKIGWLAYNLSKALHLEPVNEHDQQAAVRQVLETLTALTDYEALCPVLPKWWQDLERT